MHQSSLKTKTMTLTAVLTAIGIIIPLIIPIKIVIGPASYTLGSHIPVMIAMFISPFVAFFVAIGTTIGFQMAGFPFIIVIRALSHVIFAVIGAKILQNKENYLSKTTSRYIFSLLINLIHAVGEILVVYLITAAGMSPQGNNYYYTLFILVGLGTLIHGMVDFELGYLFSRTLSQRIGKRFTDIVRI